MKGCPLLKMKECKGGACMFWTEMTVKNVQTGEIGQQNNCAISVLPGLLAHQLQSIGGVQAAVESRGNASVEQQENLVGIFRGAANKAIKERDKTVINKK